MQVINSNIMSLNAQRNLSTSGGQLATSLQRLSSGLRVNSAKDDAAGLAISERFTTQIRGMDQAARNANDGISLSQTAEGAMGEIGNNLQRIRELAVQSRNATNSASDREALNKEAQQLKAEINRVAGQTAFNGVKLLDGSFAAQVFQVGANQGETITVDSIVNATAAALGSWQALVQPSASSLSGSYSPFLINSAGDSMSMSVDGVSILNESGPTIISAATLDTAVAAAKGQLNAAGVSFTGTVAAGNLQFSKSDGSSFSIDLFQNGGGGGFSGSDFTMSYLFGNVYAGNHSIAASGPGALKTGFADLDISSATGADAAMLAMDAALTAINTARADMGAVQNRFSSVVANLSSNSENLAAARSRIQDADFAAETAKLTRNQILQQAGTAMLAQANQAPQGVLALLR